MVRREKKVILAGFAAAALAASSAFAADYKTGGKADAGSYGSVDRIGQQSAAGSGDVSRMNAFQASSGFQLPALQAQNLQVQADIQQSISQARKRTIGFKPYQGVVDSQLLPDGRIKEAAAYDKNGANAYSHIYDVDAAAKTKQESEASQTFTLDDATKAMFPSDSKVISFTVSWKRSSADYIRPRGRPQSGSDYSDLNAYSFVRKITVVESNGIYQLGYTIEQKPVKTPTVDSSGRITVTYADGSTLIVNRVNSRSFYSTTRLSTDTIFLKGVKFEVKRHTDLSETVKVTSLKPTLVEVPPTPRPLPPPIPR